MLRDGRLRIEGRATLALADLLKAARPLELVVELIGLLSGKLYGLSSSDRKLTFLTMCILFIADKLESQFGNNPGLLHAIFGTSLGTRFLSAIGENFFNNLDGENVDGLIDIGSISPVELGEKNRKGDGIVFDPDPPGENAPSYPNGSGELIQSIASVSSDSREGKGAISDKLH